MRGFNKDGWDKRPSTNNSLIQILFDRKRKIGFVLFVKWFNNFIVHFFSVTFLFFCNLVFVKMSFLRKYSFFVSPIDQLLIIYLFLCQVLILFFIPSLSKLLSLTLLTPLLSLLIRNIVNSFVVIVNPHRFLILAPIWSPCLDL